MWISSFDVILQSRTYEAKIKLFEGQQRIVKCGHYGLRKRSSTYEILNKDVWGREEGQGWIHLAEDGIGGGFL